MVRVGTQQEAQYLISQLHHYKLGHKRISISYMQNNVLDLDSLKEMVTALLQVIFKEI